MPLLIVKSPHKMQALSESLRLDGKTIGLVPTMGALHDGHLKLVEKAVKRADIVIVSIFVNPAQFGPGEDFSKYPRAFKSDCLKIERAGANIIFHPSVDDIYPPRFGTYIDMGWMGEILEGERRHGHFKGVATICAKLFNITRPHFAVFGQKDGQQLAVIRQMVRDLNFNLEIIKGPIVRTKEGVAMSSRHAYLSENDLVKAQVIKLSLELARRLIKRGIRSASAIERWMRKLIESVPGVKVDYIAFNRWDDLAPLKKLSGEVMISLVVVISGVRLLDNTIVKI
ncbi:MAG TPA: pantoate--beta-alanine ligase [candidate division Zixibacteria bacterium]|nr:pantoate--beta-alanine ligase [candidate division Zixibacteria bacterium]